MAFEIHFFFGPISCSPRFLGLGLPWTIGSIYWAAQGRTSAWQEKYAGKAAEPKGCFEPRKKKGDPQKAGDVAVGLFV